jgi:hypothetical protein
MKFIVSISLNVMLLLIFTIVTTTSVWACGKNCHEKETSNIEYNCQKDCSQNCCSNAKNKKKKCCGDNCTCSVSLMYNADLPKQLTLETFPIRLVFIVKRVFYYKQAFSKSTIQDIWQPPLTVLSI